MVGQNPAGTGIDAIGVAIATAITSVIIAKLSGTVADAITGNPNDNEDRMYEEIHSKIGRANFHITKNAEVVPRKIETVMDQPQTMEFVQGAIEQLKEAKKTTRCGVCQVRLDEAIQAVTTKAKVIKISDAKWQIVQELKRTGKIPKNVKYGQLSPEQKAFINKVAEKGVV